MTFFVSPTSLILAHAGRRDDHRTDKLRQERAGVESRRVGNSRVAHGKRKARFVAFDEKNDEFEVPELADDFVWTTFPTMSDALAHIVRTTGEAQTTELTAWT